MLWNMKYLTLKFILATCVSINSERVRESFTYRLQKCIEVRGHYFEHLK